MARYCRSADGGSNALVIVVPATDSARCRSYKHGCHSARVRISAVQTSPADIAQPRQHLRTINSSDNWRQQLLCQWNGAPRDTCCCRSRAQAGRAARAGALRRDTRGRRRTRRRACRSRLRAMRERVMEVVGVVGVVVVVGLLTFVMMSSRSSSDHCDRLGRRASSEADGGHEGEGARGVAKSHVRHTSSRRGEEEGQQQQQQRCKGHEW